MNVGSTEVSLTPFYGFSPVLKSLHILVNMLQNSQIFDLISSLPILEDMTLAANGTDPDDVLSPDVPQPAVQPSTSPPFTGTLDLALLLGMGPVMRRLLGLPSGAHFRKLVLLWLHNADFRWLNALVVGCSGTLECLTITSYVLGTPTSFLPLAHNPPSFAGDSDPASIDLSKATKLRDAAFILTSPDVEWITLALQTITPEHRHLQRISICVLFTLALSRVGADLGQVIPAIGGSVSDWWLDLDHLLVQFWESHSIRPNITCVMLNKEKEIRECMGHLLPETTERGIIDLDLGQ